MNKKKSRSGRKGSVQKKVDWKALEIVHPDAAGIDVGGTEHWVAISPDRDAEPVRRFETFTADLTNEQSGGKVLKRRTRKVVNRASGAFRTAATTLLRSQSYLGAQYRRLRTRLGAPKAITAMARKLACLFYRLIQHGQQYVDKGTEYYEARYREQQIRSLATRAQKLGLQLVIPETA